MTAPIDPEEVRRSAARAARQLSGQDATPQEVVDDLRAQLAEPEG